MAMKSETKVKVAVRIRPPLKMDERTCVTTDKNTVEIFNYRNITENIKYEFSTVFDTDSSQSDVYNKVVVPEIRHALNGKNLSIFAYGSTGAGKTYTMVGTLANPGIIPRLLYDLFKYFNYSNNQLYSYKLKVSYLEIYNEKVRDLLTPTNGDLPIREDVHHNIIIAGLTEVEVSSFDQFSKLFQPAYNKRTTGVTYLNNYSSRSHTILRLVIEKTEQCAPHCVYVGKVLLIDLAGSENNKQTGNSGVRLRESSCINKSLFVLHEVVDAINNNLPRIPYRNSKLTRLLQDSFGGSCHSVMIASLAPEEKSYFNTYCTLNFATKSKKIVNNPTVNELAAVYNVKLTLNTRRRTMDNISNFQENHRKRNRVSIDSKYSHSTRRRTVVSISSKDGHSTRRRTMNNMSSNDVHSTRGQAVVSISSKDGYRTRRRTVASISSNDDHSTREQAVASISSNDDHSTRKQTVASISSNDDHSTRKQAVASISSKDGYRTRRRTVASISSNDDHSTREQALASISSNDDHSTREQAVASISSKDGHSTRRTMTNMSSNDVHSTRGQAVVSISSNDGYRTRRRTVASISSNDDHSTREQAVASISSNDYHSTRKQAVASISSKDGYRTRRRTVASISSNDDHSTRGQAVVSISSKDGHRTRRRTVASISSNDDHSTRKQAVVSISSNDGYCTRRRTMASSSEDSPSAKKPRPSFDTIPEAEEPIMDPQQKLLADFRERIKMLKMMMENSCQLTGGTPAKQTPCQTDRKETDINSPQDQLTPHIVKRSTSFRKSLQPKSRRRSNLEALLASMAKEDQMLIKNRHEIHRKRVLELLNSENKGDLSLLHTVGIRRSELIYEWRQTHGPFKQVDDLLQVEGLSHKYLQLFMHHNFLEVLDKENQEATE